MDPNNMFGPQKILVFFALLLHFVKVSKLESIFSLCLFVAKLVELYGIMFTSIV